jgi:4-hydroxy-4-methyl-2-oxoglutarate aldolase
MCGEIASYYSRLRKLGGAVIDGATRDTLQITEIGFPLIASHVSVSYSGKQGPGAECSGCDGGRRRQSR